MPSGRSLTVAPSRYQSLVELLADCEESEIVLTFKEIATIIGGPLPESAVLGMSWWTTTKNPPVGQWRAMGWRAHTERARLRVCFTRDAEM